MTPWRGVTALAVVVGLSCGPSEPPPEAEPGAVRIRDIQGAGHVSPLRGRRVTNVPGVVTWLRTDGFFFQDPSPDDDSATSEGLLVFIGAAPPVAVGDSVLVSGRVTEFYPGGRKTGNLATTEITDARVLVVESGSALPPPVPLGAGGRMPPTEVICDDAVQSSVESPQSPFDPAADGIDCYESLEGMRVVVPRPVVVGPTSPRFGEVWVLAAGGEGTGLRSPRGGIVVRPADFNPERIQLQLPKTAKVPDLAVADRLDDVVGVLDYSGGNFELLVEGVTVQGDRGVKAERTRRARRQGRWTVASYNVLNLHPGVPSRVRAIARHIANALASPDIVGLQEIQDGNGPVDDELVDAGATYRALLREIRAAGGPGYAVSQIDPEDDRDGGQPGGNIRVAFLYDPERVRLIAHAGGDARTAATVVAGHVRPSPGRIAPGDSAFTNSRKPLVCEFEFDGRSVVLINTHSSSKMGSRPLMGRLQPPSNGGLGARNAQATVIHGFVRRLLAADPDRAVIVLGDFNELEFLEPMRTLTGSRAGVRAALFNLTETLPPAERYTYIFQGNSQALDHVLVSRSLLDRAEYDIVHINAEFSRAASDHDPVVARFTFVE